MSAAPTSLKDTLFTNWSLTGRLNKNPEDNMAEPVRFWDRMPLEGTSQWTSKIVIVEKINAEQNESVEIHPNYTVIRDYYAITVYYRIPDIQDSNFTIAISDIESMGTEVTRILKTVYNPSNTTNTYFVSAQDWRNEDDYNVQPPYLRRKLILSLSQIKSEEPQVFRGYGGVLVFDTSASQGDNKPVSDYEYTELLNVDIQEGFAQIKKLTKDKTLGRGVAQTMRGIYAGTFTALVQGKRSDVEGSTVEKLYNIWKTQSNSPLTGQQPEVVFLHANQNQESPAKTLTTTSFMKIENMNKINGDEQLISFRMRGTLTRPTTAAIT